MGALLYSLHFGGNLFLFELLVSNLMDSALLQLERTHYFFKMQKYAYFFPPLKAVIPNTLFYVEIKLKKWTGHFFVNLVLKCP